MTLISFPSFTGKTKQTKQPCRERNSKEEGYTGFNLMHNSGYKKIF